jgi:hypothetical protein
MDLSISAEVAVLVSVGRFFVIVRMSAVPVRKKVYFPKRNGKINPFFGSAGWSGRAHRKVGPFLLSWIYAERSQNIGFVDIG